MPTEDHPVNQPLIPISIDDAIKKLYGPAIEEQLRHDLPLFNMIAPETRPTITPFPRWTRVLLVTKERLNSCYMHLRYGECNDLKEWNNHDC